jgi:hypothetical protein
MDAKGGVEEPQRRGLWDVREDSDDLWTRTYHIRLTGGTRGLLKENVQ